MAKTVAHPMDTATHIEPITRDAIQFILQHHPDLVKLERRKNLLQAKLLSKQHAAEEQTASKLSGLHGKSVGSFCCGKVC